MLREIFYKAWKLTFGEYVFEAYIFFGKMEPKHTVKKRTEKSK